MIDFLALADRCDNDKALPDRSLDADIAIAIYRDDTHPDPRDNTHARRVLISHGARPGNYEVVGFSGVSLHTAPAFTDQLGLAMALALPGMRARIEIGDTYSCCEILSGWGARERCVAATVERPDGEIALCVVAAWLRARADQDTPA